MGTPAFHNMRQARTGNVLVGRQASTPGSWWYGFASAAPRTRVCRDGPVSPRWIGRGVFFAGFFASVVTLGGCTAGQSAKGPLWTIQCLELQGPHRSQHIHQISENLKRTAGIRPSDVFVMEESDGFARLYYGKYRRPLDPSTGEGRMPARMREDLNLIRELGDSSGRRFFLQALPVRLPQPSVGNPAWDLSTVRAKYSLQVAVFEPTGDFTAYKQAAADYCTELRERGYEAYYHHGPASSVVTVGAFGADAVKNISDGHVWRTVYSSQVLTLQRDELLKYNRLNGHIYRVRNQEGTLVPVPSRLVEVPHKEETEPW